MQSCICATRFFYFLQTVTVLHVCDMHLQVSQEPDPMVGEALMQSINYPSYFLYLALYCLLPAPLSGPVGVLPLAMPS